MQVLFLGRAPRTKETLPDFLKWRRVTRPPLVFRGLTGSQRTPGFWVVTWGAPTHVLRKEPHKLESRNEVCLFIGYPKGTRGGLFYSSPEKNVIMSTNAKFFEEDYVNNFKPKSNVILEELDSAQESPKPPEFGPIVPLFPVRVQQRENENILEGEQA